jgi:hypothetical protein
MGLEDKPHLWHDGQGDQALYPECLCGILVEHSLLIL